METTQARHDIRTRLLVLLILVVAFTTQAPAQSSSPSYRLQTGTLGALGGPGSSVSTHVDGTLAQSSTVGASASFHYIVESGHWSFTGSTVVPVVLQTSKHPGNPGAVDLTWSGNNAPYSIYRATNPASIYGDAALALTSNNAYDDTSPPAGALVCYSVLAGP